MTCDEPGALCREHHQGCIEGMARATCHSPGPQVDAAGDFAARSDQKVHASQDGRASPEARGGSEHLGVHATSVSKERRFNGMPAATGAPESQRSSLLYISQKQG